MAHGLLRSGTCVLTTALLGCSAPAPEAPAALTRARLAFESVDTARPPSGVVPQARPGDAPGPAAPGPSALPSAAPDGGGGQKAGSSVQHGRVFGYGADLQPVPLEGATVWAGDGRQATTDASGRFTMPGPWPEGGSWTVYQPGYRASTIIGLPPGGEAELHVKTDAAVAHAPVVPATRSFTIAGRVVRPGGRACAGAALRLTAPDGTFSAPTNSEPDGTFQMTVFSAGDVVRDATFLAVDYQDPAIGAMTGLTVASGAAELDFEPRTAGADALVVTPATHPLDVAVDDAGAGLPAKVSVELSIGDREHLLLYADQNTAMLADVPGVRYGVLVEAADPGRVRRSVYADDDLAVDFAAPATHLSVSLLAPPELHPLGPGPLEAIAWDPVSGARGYEVRLDDALARGYEWEAFTQGQALRYSGPTIPLVGRYALKVLAWDADGMGARQVASVNQLRLLPTSGAYRVSSTTESVEIKR